MIYINILTIFYTWKLYNEVTSEPKFGDEIFVILYEIVFQTAERINFVFL